MPEPMGKDKVLQLLQSVLSYATADQTEVSFNGDDTALTRFANSYIHQNVQENNTTIKVRSVVGQKIGTASGNSLDPADLKALVARAEQLAKFQVEDPNFQSLPGPELAANTAAVSDPDEATYYASPEVRAIAVGEICRRSVENNLIASGAFRTKGYEVAIANSLGLTNYYRGASADIITVIMGENSSGYAARLSQRVDGISGAEVGQEAIDKALRSRDPRTLEPGDYEVVLEDYAVATMLEYMSYLGMGALSLQEGRSFMQLNRSIMSESVSLYDDGTDPRGIVIPFDAEGVARQPVTLIERGVAKNVTYDTYTAAKEPGHTSTGHSIGEQGEIGPIPLNMFLEAGDTPKADLLKGIKRGLYVTRFHYVNPLVPDKAILTGMTRDGTFLVENGEIVAPVKNFRFTQSAVEALNNVLAISSERRLLQGDYFANSYVPSLRIGKFTFNSGTEF